MPLADRLVRRYYLRGIGNRLLSGRAMPQPPCVALNSHLRLLPNGDVPTCQFNGQIVGNLCRQSVHRCMAIRDRHRAACLGEPLRRLLGRM